jgi:hypothetical protein
MSSATASPPMSTLKPVDAPLVGGGAGGGGGGTAGGGGGGGAIGWNGAGISLLTAGL